MRVVEFLIDFADKTKGEQFRCDGMLANQLVVHDGVAKYVDVVSETDAVFEPLPEVTEETTVEEKTSQPKTKKKGK
jgi:hypothetical protein